MRVRTAGRWPRTSRAVRSRPAPRGVLRVTAVTVILVAAGVTAGSAPAASQASEQHVTLRLGYTCGFRSAATPVSAQVTATYPAAATVGQPIQPTGTRIAVTLPHAAVADLTRLHAAAATMTAGLGTEVTEGAKSSAATWQNFTSPATEIPQSGPMTLTASGAPAETAGATPGEMTITAESLALLFAGHPANGSSARSSSVPVMCVPAASQSRTLAHIAVTPAASSPGHPARRSAQAATTKYCPHYPKHLKLNPRFPLPPPIRGATAHYLPEKACAYATGFTNAQKLHEAVLVGPGLTDLLLGIPTFIKFTPPGFSYFYQRGAGQLEYRGRPQLPPAKATLLAFGFMPVSATIQISEIGSLNVALISCTPTAKAKCPAPPNVALFYGLVSLHISDVSINGVPLNVGSQCQTATPFELALTGVPPAYDVSTVHGVLTGTVNIPSFSGCANGTDNLDPIFDATVSGPGNFAKITQAVPCFTATPTRATCPPRKPHPRH